MNKGISIGMICLILIIWGGCDINEDLSNCYRGIHISFKTINPNYQFEEIIGSLDLYLYNHEEVLVEKYSYSQQQLISTNYKAYIPYHASGEYFLVAIVNPHELYAITGEDELITFHNQLITDSNNIISSKLPDIYHSFKEIRFTEATYVTNDTLMLSKNTNHIKLEVEIQGYTLPENSSIKTNITGANGIYDYINRPLNGPDIIYLPHTNLENRVEPNNIFLKNESTILRMWIGDNLTINIEQYNGSNFHNLLKSFRLTEIITALSDPETGQLLYSTDEKLGMEDIFNIKVTLDGSMKIVALLINDWYAIRPDVDL